MAELSVQEQILIELKKQNALLEEQLRPQREADARKKAEDIKREKYKQAQMKHEANVDKLTAIVKSYRQTRNSIESRISQPYPSFPNYMGDAGLSPYERQQISDWREASVKIPEQLAEVEKTYNMKLEEVLSTYSDKGRKYYYDYIQKHIR
jgi:hypothetical protein